MFIKFTFSFLEVIVSLLLFVIICIQLFLNLLQLVIQLSKLPVPLLYHHLSHLTMCVLDLFLELLELIMHLLHLSRVDMLIIGLMSFLSFNLILMLRSRWIYPHQ